MHSVLASLTLYSYLPSDLPFQFLHINLISRRLVPAALALLLLLCVSFVYLPEDVSVQLDLLQALRVDHVDGSVIARSCSSPHLLGTHEVPLLLFVVKVDLELLPADEALDLSRTVKNE